MVQAIWWITRIVMLVVSMVTTPVLAEELVGPRTSEQESESEILGSSSEAKPQLPEWHYGGFVDLGYSLNFNFPENHLFRNRSTTPRVNELDLNMGGVYVRKDATTDSRWGMELMGHGGQDALNFGFGTNLPHVAGSDALRHFGRANLSYLAPVGNGLTFQAGLFNSFIGYESLYAKDNFNYTRAWIADYSPYLMFGANAQYKFNDHWSGVFFMINEYFHLQNANSLPSYGAQSPINRAVPGHSRKQSIMALTSRTHPWSFGGLFSDSIVEWKVNDDVTLAGEYQVGTQENGNAWKSSCLLYGSGIPDAVAHRGPWSVALRPEVYWDPNGLITGSEQLIRAVTTTAEYKFPYKWTNMIARLEYRYDESTGEGGASSRAMRLRQE